MGGPDQRDQITRIFGEVMRDVSGSVPLQVQFLLEGECSIGLDLNDPELLERMDVEREDIKYAYDHITAQIQDEFESILLDRERLFRDEFGICIAISPSDWNDYFGKTPPGNIDSWKPFVEQMASELIPRYQMNMEIQGRVPSLPESIEPYTRDEFDFQESPRWVLSIDVDPATELDKLGLMSRPQALVYILRSYDYTTEQVADLIEKKTGTTASHGSRAKKKAARYRYAVELLNYYDEDLPPDWGVLGDKIGQVYENAEGTQIRVIGGDSSPSGEPVFYAQRRDGSVEQYSNSAFEQLNLVSGEYDDFPEIPEMFRERGYTGESIDIDEDELSSIK